MYFECSTTSLNSDKKYSNIKKLCKTIFRNIFSQTGDETQLSSYYFLVFLFLSFSNSNGTVVAVVWRRRCRKKLLCATKKEKMSVWWWWRGRWRRYFQGRPERKIGLEKIAFAFAVRPRLMPMNAANIKYIWFTHLRVVPFASAARSRWRRFLNQFETCVTVKSVISASSRFSRGLKESHEFRAENNNKNIPWIRRFNVPITQNGARLLLETVWRLFAIPNRPWQGKLAPDAILADRTEWPTAHFFRLDIMSAEP